MLTVRLVQYAILKSILVILTLHKMPPDNILSGGIGKY